MSTSLGDSHDLESPGLCVVVLAIDDYAKDGVPEVVRHLCSLYQDPLRS